MKLTMMDHFLKMNLMEPAILMMMELTERVNPLRDNHEVDIYNEVYSSFTHVCNKNHPILSSACLID